MVTSTAHFQGFLRLGDLFQIFKQMTEIESGTITGTKTGKKFKWRIVREINLSSYTADFKTRKRANSRMQSS